MDRVEMIASWLGLFMRPGQVDQLHAHQVGGSRMRHAFFRGEQLAQAAAQALRWEADGARSVRFVLNPLRSDIFATPRRYAHNEDVIARQWVLLDCEHRQGHSDGPSSEEERAAAWDVLCRVRGALEAAGCTGLIVADSGNGWHGLLPVDLPNDEASKVVVRTLLAGLSERCSDDVAHLDPAPYHAITAAKVYGTLSRRGEATAERPHRVSQIVAASMEGVDRG